MSQVEITNVLMAVYFGMSRDGGAVFEVGMVRSFRKSGVPAHEANARLRLSFSYPFVETVIHGGLDMLPGWPEGNKFCWAPNDQAGLRSFISSSGQIQAVLKQPPRATKLRFESLWGVFLPKVGSGERRTAASGPKQSFRFRKRAPGESE